MGKLPCPNNKEHKVKHTVILAGATVGGWLAAEGETYDQTDKLNLKLIGKVKENLTSIHCHIMAEVHEVTVHSDLKP